MAVLHKVEHGLPRSPFRSSGIMLGMKPVTTGSFDLDQHIITNWLIIISSPYSSLMVDDFLLIFHG